MTDIVPIRKIPNDNTNASVQKIIDDNTDIHRRVPNLAENEMNQASDYDPHLHRNVEDTTSNIQALVHILKGCIDSSLLALPQAFRFSGYVIGIIGVIFVGTLTWFSWRNLIRSKFILCKRHRTPMLSYGETMEKAFEDGPYFLKRLSFLAKPIIEGMLVVQQVGVCCVYSVFVPSHIKPLFDTYVTVWDIKIYIAIMMIPSFLLICIPSLKHLAPIAQMANIFALIGVAIILYYILKDGLNSPSKEDAFGSIESIPLFFSITLFSINPIGIINSVENSMEKPKSFNKIIIIEITIVSILFIAFGVLGFLRYGDAVKGSIALNLPSDEIPAEVADLLFAVCVLISYSLHAYVPLKIIWKRYFEKRCSKSAKGIRLLWYFGLRVIFVLFTCAFAMLIPFIDLFIAFVGALTLSLLGITFPAFLALCVKQKEKYDWKTILVKCTLVVVMIIGILAMIFGTYFSISDIILRFESNK